MQKNDLLELQIDEINNLGCGVGKIDGKVVFIFGAVTGDTVLAKIIKVNKTYCVGKIEKIIKPSTFRSKDSFCSAPLSCGGCVYRHISYEHELQMKKNYVVHAFRKVGLVNVYVDDVKTTGRIKGYRNKAQLPLGASKFEGTKRIFSGFYASKTHNIIRTSECSLQNPIFSEIADFVCNFMSEHNVSVYDENSGKGLLRHIYLRIAEKTKEVMLCLVINGDDIPFEREFVKRVSDKFPNVVSIYTNINKKSTNIVLGDRFCLLYGKEYITDILCGLKINIAPGAFYQVNRDGAELLYSLVKERADLDKNQVLLDLYCGAGTIGLSMASEVKELVGIEIVKEAVQCAKLNAQMNNIKNANFYCGDASDISRLFDEAEKERGEALSADTVIIDPPRKGVTPQLINFLAEKNIRKIVYVSCDPDTLARDCVEFEKLGYAIGNVTPVDMFPRTGHVESVVCLTRKP